MSIWIEIVQASSILFNNWVYLLIGVSVGMILGALPGLGGAVTLALLIPFTLSLNQHEAFILMTGAIGAVTFAGSISAILINTPGSSGNAATLLDGYPLSEQGKGAMAIGASAVSSAAGAIVGITVFLIAIPVVIQFALLFGPSEIFWLVIFAMIIIPLVAGNKKIAGIAMAGFGLWLATVGRTPATGEVRFAYGIPDLFEGVQLIPVVIGLFTYAEMIKLAASERGTISDNEIKLTEKAATKFDGIRETLKHKFLWFRCVIIGIVIGIIPGVGASVATFIAYGHAVQSSPNPETFGEGRIEGVIASEAANDAKDGGQLFPTLGLGIPGSGTMAIFLAAFIMHGIIPGPRMLIDETELMVLIAVTLLIANVLTSIIGLLFTNWFTQVTKLPIPILFPAIVLISTAAVFTIRNSLFDVFIALSFGVLGILLMYYGISRVPIIVALVLGSIMEHNLWLAIQYQRGDFITALFTNPLSLILIILLFIVIFVEIYRYFAKTHL